MVQCPAGKLAGFFMRDAQTNMNTDEPFSMIQEACESYRAVEQPDGRLIITIVADRRFANLWIVKLNELTGTLAEADSLAD